MTREQIIKEAIMGKMGKPFVPDEETILREMKKRSVDLTASPVRSDMTSDIDRLRVQMLFVEEEITSLISTEKELDNRMNDLSMTERQELTGLRIDALKVKDGIEDTKASSPLTERWTPSIGEHFRSLENIDLSRTSASILPYHGMAQLASSDSMKIDPAWKDTDAGRVTVVSGQEFVKSTSVVPGSSLRNLVDGTPDPYLVKIDYISPGAVIIDILIPLPENPMLNRIELSVDTPLIADVYLVNTDGSGRKLSGKELIETQGRWFFNSQEVAGIRFMVYTESTSVGLAEMGFYHERYKSEGTVTSASRGLSDDSVIDRVSLHVNEFLPSSTDITYKVGIDLLVSGAFVNTEGEMIDPGYSAIAFDPYASGTVYSTELRDFSFLPGASGYQGWEPDWFPIEPASRSNISDAPRVVVFDHVKHYANVSGIASSFPNDSDHYPLTYLGDVPGWWRPFVEHGERVPDASSVFPDMQANGIDFYFIHYFPPEKLPVEDSIALTAGTSLDVNNVITSSGALWSTAVQSAPGLVDNTVGYLEPDISGIISHTASGNILFDTIRNLRFVESHDEPFIRGQEYFVFGSGNYMELDVAVIASQNAAFGQQNRLYEITYTAEISEGTLPTYLYNALVHTSDNNATVTINRTDILHDVRIVHIGTGSSIDNIEYIEFPSEEPAITRTLVPGYTRIVLTSTVENYNVTDDVTFTGPVSSFETLKPMELLSPEKLYYSKPRYDHGVCALIPHVSGSLFLAVNDPGSEADRVFGNVTMGGSYTSSPKHIFHDGASGLIGFYNLSYDEIIRAENRILFRADLMTDDPGVTPSLYSYRIDVSPHVNLTPEELLGLDIGKIRGIQS